MARVSAVPTIKMPLMVFRAQFDVNVAIILLYVYVEKKNRAVIVQHNYYTMYTYI